MAPLHLRDLDPLLAVQPQVAPDCYYFPFLGLNFLSARDCVSEVLKVRAWDYVRVYLGSGDHSPSVRDSIRRHLVAVIIR